MVKNYSEGYRNELFGDFYRAAALGNIAEARDLAESLGYSYEQLTSQDINPETEIPLKESGLEKSVGSEGALDREYFYKIAKIALRRFSEMQRGERGIPDREVRERFSQLKKAGYPLEPYSKMTKEQRWKYLQNIRADIYGDLEDKYPEILSEIKERNRLQKSGLED